ncbi:MAG: class IV adenylate cyclase [Candidatus Baldrarchaeia archaeon]
MSDIEFSDDVEVEIKAKINNIDEMRERIKVNGGKLVSKNLIRDFSFDYENEELRKRDCVLRVRVFESGEGIITFKGPRKGDKRYKIREELEVHVGNGLSAVKIFERLGFKQVFRIDRIREIYEFEEEGVRIMLDVFPEIGVFMEVEGSKRGIEKVVRKLRMNRSAFTVLTLHHYIEEFKKKFGRVPKLTFDN